MEGIKMNKRIIKWLTGLLLAVLMVAGLGPTLAHATGSNDNTPSTDFMTEVNIHKIKTDRGASPMDAQELEEGITGDNYANRFGPDAEGLPGVIFDVYKVSKENFDNMMDNPGAYTTPNQAATMGTFVVSSSATDQNGLTKVTLGEGYFWVVERGLTTIASSTAVPFGLTLPYTNATGDGNLSTIHVYPKNTLQDTPDVEKTIDESDASQYIGQPFDWTVSSKIPKGIKEYTKYEFVDVIDEKLDYVSTTLTSPSNLVLGTDYTITHDPDTNTLTVAFTATGIAKLVADQNITYTISTKINNRAVMGDPIKNDVDLNFKNPHTEGKAGNPDTPEVATGGHKFKKTVETTDGTPLNGAEFVIINSNNQYIIQDESTLAVTFTTDIDEATRFVSGRTGDGRFEVKGLAYGAYILRETKAPSGYALPTKPDTPFVVSSGSYEETVLKAIPNRQLTIPQTGGMGTMAFTIIGGLLMVFAVVYYRKTKEA